VKSAQSDLDTAKAQQTTLQSKLGSIASVQDAYLQVSAKQAMLTQAMGSEIRWSYYLTDLSLKMPDNVWITNMQATENPALSTTPAPIGAAALVPTGIGSITFTGIAFSHDDVATWLDILGKERGWTNPYFTSSVEGLIGAKKVVNFTSSVVMTDAAKSGRYTKPAGS
jgi:Tfp pilus assembly protein PilN